MNKYITTTQIISEAAINTDEFIQHKKFDLSIPRTMKQVRQKSRWFERRIFAIVCYSDKPKTDIMEYIQRTFGNTLQYACIASNTISNILSNTIYIQIVLEKAIKKKKYFLKDIVGLECNYKVTYNNRAWNIFLKKVGDCIEFGEFQLVKFCKRTNSSVSVRQNTHQRRKWLKSNCIQECIGETENIDRNKCIDICIHLVANVEESIERLMNEAPNHLCKGLKDQMKLICARMLIERAVSNQ